MISSFQTIFPDFHWNPNHNDSSYAKSITFFVLNFMSGGIFGTYTTAYLDQKCRLLQEYQVHYIKRLAENSHSMEKIELNIQSLSEKIQMGMVFLGTTLDPYNSELNSIQNEINAIQINYFFYLLDVPPLLVIKRIFLNIITLGLYGCVENNMLKKQHAQLQAENQYLKIKFTTQAVNTKKYLSKQISSLKIYAEELKLLQLKQSEKSVNFQNEWVHAQQNKAIEEQIIASDKAKMQAKKLIVDQLKHTQQEITLAAIQVKKQSDKITAAQQRLISLKETVESIQANINLGSHEKMGPENREIRLSNGQIIHPTTLIEPPILANEYHPIYQVYQGQLTAYQAIESSFKYCFDELVKASEDGSLPIIFNRSAEIFTNPKCKMNMKAVYRYMAYHLISNSQIVNDHTLQINAEGLTLFSSCPEYVRTCKVNPITPEVILNFKYNDAFTPPPGKELSKGIDPVMAKQIWLQLNQEERGILLWLLLEPIIPDDNEILKQFLENFKTESDSMLKVRACYGLMCDMGEAIDKKFGPSLGFLWLDHADDYTAQPLIKEVEDMLFEDEGDGDLVDWTIDIESFQKVDQNFAKMILTSQNHYKRIWASMSQSLVLNPYHSESELTSLNGNNFRDVLRNQYYVWYQMLGGHFCLFSALCAVTLSDASQFTDANVTKIHKAMANHLDKPEVKERFKSLILSEHSKSVEEYQKMLRREHVVQYLGDTEISIFADLMGVRVVVFFPEDSAFKKVKLDEYGLQTPVSSLNYFGPNTKERLYVTYQSSGENYYYTFPKLKTNVLSGEAGQSVGVVDAYWKTVRHNYYY